MAGYTLVHVLISLVGIASGFVVVYGLITSRRLDRWTALFLATTVAMSVTGFGFPFVRHQRSKHSRRLRLNRHSLSRRSPRW
jgi:hypothetical protein